jgi:hypothetical protein
MTDRSLGSREIPLSAEGSRRVCRAQCLSFVASCWGNSFPGAVRSVSAPMYSLGSPSTPLSTSALHLSMTEIDISHYT